MQADRVSRSLRLTLILDRRAVDESKRAQRSHGLIKTVASQSRSERLAKFFASLGKHCGIGSGASSDAWTISGSAAGCSFAASSIASANVFATVSPSWYSAGAWRTSSRNRAGAASKRANPAEPDAEPDEIGAHGWLGLRPYPPGRPVIAAMLCRVGGRERRLADAAKPVQGRDGDPAFLVGERSLDRGKGVVAPHEMRRYPDRDVGGGKRFARLGHADRRALRGLCIRT